MARKAAAAPAAPEMLFMDAAPVNGGGTPVPVEVGEVTPVPLGAELPVPTG
jgi:hypothetical protein